MAQLADSIPPPRQQAAQHMTSTTSGVSNDTASPTATPKSRPTSETTIHQESEPEALPTTRATEFQSGLVSPDVSKDNIPDHLTENEEDMWLAMAMAFDDFYQPYWRKTHHRWLWREGKPLTNPNQSSTKPPDVDDAQK